MKPIQPNTTNSEVTFMGKVVSEILDIWSLLVAIFRDEGVTDVAAIEFGM